MGTLTEAILGTASDVLEVLHAANAIGLAALGLVGPMVTADLCGWVATAGTALVLDVERALATPQAKTVGLLVALAHRWSSITHVDESLLSIVTGPWP